MRCETEIIEFNNANTYPIENYYNKIIHGDCLEVMKSLPDKSVDIIITSPPYNLLNSTGNGLKKNTHCGKWVNAAIKDGYKEYDDNMPYDEYVSWQRECVAEMVRLIKDDGAVFYNNKNRVQGGLLQDRGEIVKDSLYDRLLLGRDPEQLILMPVISYPQLNRYICSVVRTSNW